MSERLCIIVQARVGGARFPGKVLAPLLGQPMLLWQLDRLSRIQTPHTLVVACPSTPENEAIQQLCTQHGYRCARPEVPEYDVLARYQYVAQQYEATEIVRCTGDTPLIDPQGVDALIVYHRWHRKPLPDHTGIAAEWPDGQDIECFSRNALERAHAEATMASDREHVSAYLWRNQDRFACQTFPCPFNYADLQYSVDTPDDLQLVSGLLSRCLERYGHMFGWREVAQVLRTDAFLARLHAARAPRNQAYVTQVAAEQGLAAASWAQLRYGKV